MKKINSINKSFFRKIFIKLNRKLGFEIIDQNSLTLPTSNKKINENLNIFNHKDITLPLGEIKIERKINSFLVIFRSFTKENKLLSQNKKRLFEKQKKEYTFRSLHSICRNINLANKHFKNVNFFLKVIDDNSDLDVKKNLIKICKNNKVKFVIENLDIEINSKKINFKDNKRMIAHNCHILQSKEFAKNSNFDLIYFVEDDYLHDHDAIIEMIYAYQKFSTLYKSDIILCPADYPYLYSKYEQTNILIGHKKHWRQTNESLCTYLVSKAILNKYWNYYEDMFLNNYDPYEKPLHKLYKKVKCFSPMPSLALHLTNINSIYGLSPIIDWIKIWKKNNYK